MLLSVALYGMRSSTLAQRPNALVIAVDAKELEVSREIGWESMVNLLLSQPCSHVPPSSRGILANSRTCRTQVLRKGQGKAILRHSRVFCCVLMSIYKQGTAGCMNHCEA